MQLKDYIPKIDNKIKKTFFSGISFDSSKIKKNYIFFAIKGENIDGNNFIPNALKRGSKIVITQKKIKNFQKEVL